MDLVLALTMPSEMPRFGSRNERTHSAIKMPGIPTARNAACQPFRLRGAVADLERCYSTFHYEAPQEQTNTATDVYT